MAALVMINAKIDRWEAVIGNAEEQIARLSIERVREIATREHPDARALHLSLDAEGYLIAGMFAADGRDMIDGTETVDGIEPADDLVEAVLALPRGAVAYDRVADTHLVGLPGGPPRCTACGRTEIEDDSCADDIYGRHRYE
ncbi:hypothetical protein SIM91_05960 [Rhodococcus opacus]|uniref:hypothetical protein n=1 Tax=Rhodococcus opacus TaxID=37919 RepID=UPI0002A25912|nr:hypothetical protein [Rhodococcus opacus]ELB92479.1 hypothetical protein Rwratislav_13938 [Rhodococcus wratislaviensis IFP 2016]MDX5962860.1 hypothetical protein [Rhodococcus opacus]CAG7637122.1 hypothetical protein E143388_07862 [Rhodococcus opacus]